MTVDKNGRRPPPAFQTYAPDRLADRNFKAMSAAERGVLHTMEMECWVNGCVPADERELARVLSLDTPELQQALTPRVMLFFQRQDTEQGAVIVSPELIDYRRKCDETRERRSAGGKQSAARINQQRKDSQADRYPDRQADSSLRGEERKGEERKGVSLESGAITEEHRQFLADYEGPALHETEFSRRRGRKEEWEASAREVSERRVSEKGWSTAQNNVSSRRAD